MFAERGIDTATTDASMLPTDWTTTHSTDETKTIKVEEAEEKSDETYNVMNIHFYLNENTSDILNNGVSFDEQNNPVFSPDLTNNLVLAEWETVEVNKNDIVTTISEAEPMGYRSAAFYRYMDGYTNGYWIPNFSIFTSTAVYSNSIWYKGAAQEFSYIDGTTDRKPITNALSLYAYTFQRLKEEPEKVEEYIPDYWDTELHVEYEKPNYQEYTPNYITKEKPNAPVYLNALNYLTYTPRLPIPIEEKEPTPVPIEKEEDIISTTTEEIPIVIEPIILNTPEEESSTDIPVIFEYPAVLEIESPVSYPQITSNNNNTSTEEIELIDIEDNDTPLGLVNFYDYRGIPVKYSPRESGIYRGSNKGMIPTGGYLRKTNLSFLDKFK